MQLIKSKMKLKPPPLRQPPPPPRRQSSGSPMDGLTDSQLHTAKRNEEEEEEGNTLINLPKRRVKLKNGRLNPFYIRRSKRLMNINSLPDEIVFDILVRIPAQDIYGAVRPVCRKWYQMIHSNNFINTHLHRSTYGLLIQDQGSVISRLSFMSLSRQGKIELTRLSYVPRYELWCSSCNGLILESERGNHLALYITNPVTMQHFSLPRSPVPLLGMSFLYSAIAYAPLSMEYKVVRAYYCECQWYCAILTVGGDEPWRRICTQHLSVEAKDVLKLKPLTTEGFVHWAKTGNHVLTLNVETEIITGYPVPSVCSGDGFGYSHYYFPTAKYLSMLIACRPCRGWMWEVWEMKPETGEWTKLPGIELKDRQCEIFGGLCERDGMFKSVGDGDSWWLVPVGWVEYKEVLVYRVRCRNILKEPSACIAWNIRLKELEFFELDSDHNVFFGHRNSLLWLDGC